ncbi:MAG: flavodoxin family protein [Thermoplasmata archaeon]|jgi:flavorubredoxin
MPTAIVVFDSWYGCTQTVAEEIARGLSADGRIPTVVTNIRETTPEQILHHDIIVIGSPDHFGTPTSRILTLLRSLRQSDLRRKRFAFFDTCFASDRGKVTAKMEAALRTRNPMISPPFLQISIVVEGARGPIRPGEISKGRALGQTIRTSLALPA